MNGNLRVLLDTNAVISLLAGNRELSERLSNAEYVGISIITYLEFLAFDGLTEADRTCFESLCERIQIESLKVEDNDLLRQALELRSRYHLKLPDAVIGATALVRKAVLVTNDTHFSAITPLSVQAC